MSDLRVYLLGQVKVFASVSPQPVKVTRHVQALLAYLLLQRHRSHPRDVLAELFWGDHGQDRARTCLNTAMCRLRHTLEPDDRLHGTFVLSTSSGDVSFNTASDYWFDVAVFEEQSEGALQLQVELLQDAHVQSLKRALDLYRGDLLDGFTDDWALRERERLRTLQLNILAHLMHYYSHRRAYKEAIEWGQRILAQEPLREEIQREVMRLYVADGQRPQALRQYEMCRQILAAELNIAPMEETQAMRAEILSENTEQPSPMVDSGLSLYRRMQDELALALQSFDEASAHLKQLRQLLEKSIECP